jgi:hypothetical protein
MIKPGSNVAAHVTRIRRCLEHLPCKTRAIFFYRQGNGPVMSFSSAVEVAGRAGHLRGEADDQGVGNATGQPRIGNRA